MKHYMSRGDSILVNEINSHMVTAMVDDSTAKADEDGKKYLLAGTLLTSDKDMLLTDDGSAVMKPTTDASTAQGILLHHTDITAGAQRCSVVVEGIINRHMVLDDVKDKYLTDTNVKSLKNTLPNITIEDRI